MRTLACALLLLAAIACSPGDGPSGGGTPATAPVKKARPGMPCPECEGEGFSLRGAPGRPCLLCEGGGACAVCRGSAEGGSSCMACGGNGRCPGCDGGVARTLPGVCAWCSGVGARCGACDGRGTDDAGRSCALCDGGASCPDCLGDGGDLWCASGGRCLLCLGHGRVLDGTPVDGWPPFRLRLADGTTFRGALLQPPGRVLSLEHEVRGKLVRDAWLPRDVDPLYWLAALARTADTAKDHLEMGRFALDAGGPCLAVAVLEFRRTRELSPDLGTATLVSMALTRQGEELGEKSAPAAGDEGLGEEALRRKLAAQRERFRRGCLRAGEWRGLAERRLATTDATVRDLLRSVRSAEESIRAGARAANLAPGAVDVEPALVAIRRARHVRVRATIAIAHRILKAGRPERARAMAAIALGHTPDDEGARQFAAVVDEALARKETE